MSKEGVNREDYSKGYDVGYQTALRNIIAFAEQQTKLIKNIKHITESKPADAKEK